jgi:hypothetical protein
VYNDAPFYRVSLQSPDKTASGFRPDSKLWVDAGADALQNWPFESSQNYREYFAPFPGADRLLETSFQARPDKGVCARFVDSLLDSATARINAAEWLSVPQLPYVDGTGRNKINRALADGARGWKAKRKYRGKLVVPVILTNQRQINKKTERNNKIALAVSCLELSGGDGLWVVDSSLNDQDGTGNFESIRFPGIVSLHEELAGKISPDTFVIGGPYWGLNLILWAKGFIHYAAIGVGRAFQYYVPGGPLRSAAARRIALPPLRRLAIWSPELKSWLEDVLTTVPKHDAAHAEFANILKNFQMFRNEDQARLQVAQFYRGWLTKLEETSPAGRTLALYQDFSSAYVLGKSLSDLPPQGQARSASRIAKQFMGNCL